MTKEANETNVYVLDACTDFQCCRIDLVEIKEGLVNKIPNTVSFEKGFRHYYLPIYKHDDGYNSTLEDWVHKVLSTIFEIVDLIECNTQEAGCDDEIIEIRPSYYRQSAYLVLYAYLLSYYSGNVSRVNKQMYSILNIDPSFDTISWPLDIKNHVIPKIINYYSNYVS